MPAFTTVTSLQSVALRVQAASIAVYILSGLTGMGFIATFVICIVSLMLDFWTVRGCVLRKALVVILVSYQLLICGVCFCSTASVLAKIHGYGLRRFPRT